MNQLIRYQIWVITVALLFSVTQWTTANGQGPIRTQANSAPRNVGLGRMWVNVARWRWQLSNQGLQQPAFDSSSVEKFRLTVAKGNPAGLHNLYNAVQKKLPGQSYYGVSNEDFIQTLESVLRKKSEFKSNDIDNIIARLRGLDAAKPAELDNATTATNQESLAEANSPISPSTVAPTGGVNETPEQSSSTLVALEIAQADNERLLLFRNVFAIVAVLAILALVGSLFWCYQLASEASPKQVMAPAANKGLPSNHNKGSSNHYIAKLEQELIVEKQRYSQLQGEYKDLKTRYERLDANTGLVSSKPTPIASTLATNSPLAVAAQPNTQPLSVQFADKPENRYLTRLYPDSEAYRPLLIRFSTDSSVSEARFEFNPAADQFFFTHNGVDQLTGTFTYSPPDWLKNPQTIRTLVPGRLRRDGTGWFVDAPAQIEIC